MGASRWSEQDIAVLREKYPTSGTDIPILREKFSTQAIRVKACNLGIGNVARKEGMDASFVMFHGARVPFGHVLDYYGVSCGIYKTKQFELLGKQELTDRFEKMFIDVDGILQRTVSSFVLPEEEYISWENKLWTPTYYIAYYRPSWDNRAFWEAKRLNSLTNQQTLEYLEGGHRRRCYTSEEDDIIRENSDMTANELSALLHNRSADSVYMRARSLGITLSLGAGDNYIRCMSHTNAHVLTAATGYVGTDGEQYCFLVCAVCKRVLLVKCQDGTTFQHDESGCQSREVPAGCALPRHISRRLKGDKH